MSNIYYWEKLTFSKFVGKLNFSGRKFYEICTSFEDHKGAKYIWGNVYFGIICLHFSFLYKTVSQISFNFLCLGDKRLLSEFLGKWGWFQWHNEGFAKYLGEKLKFQKNWGTVL